MDYHLFCIFILLMVLSNILYYPYSRFSHTLSSHDIPAFDTPFVLYLRSFVVDNDTKIERFITKSLESLMQMVAVGVPRKLFHKFVAYRLYLTNREWEKNVETLAKKAELIIMRPNSTNGCEKEISICSKLIHLGKVIYLINSYEELKALMLHPSMKDYCDALNDIEQECFQDKILLIRFYSKESIDTFLISSFDKSNRQALIDYLQPLKVSNNNSIWNRFFHGITSFTFPLAYINLYRWPLYIRVIVNVVILLCAYLVFVHKMISYMLWIYAAIISVIGLLSYKLSTNNRKHLTTRHLNAALWYPWIITLCFVCVTCAALMWISIFGVYYSNSFHLSGWMICVEFLVILFILVTILKHAKIFKELLASNI